MTKKKIRLLELCCALITKRTMDYERARFKIFHRLLGNLPRYSLRARAHTWDTWDRILGIHGIYSTWDTTNRASGRTNCNLRERCLTCDKVPQTRCHGEPDRRPAPASVYCSIFRALLFC